MNKKPKRIQKYDVFAIPRDTIYVDTDFNCRGEFTLHSCQELARSIRDRGLDIPLIVQPAADVEGGLPPGFDFRLIAGFRRERAMRMILKLDAYYCVIRKGLTEQQARDLNFMENLERRDLSMLEEARWLASRYPDGVTLKKAAKDLKRPTRWVHTRLRLLKMPKGVQKQASTGLLSDVNIEALAQLDDPSAQTKAAKAIVAARRKFGRNARIKGYATRSFRLRRTKAEVNRMIERLLEAGISGLAPRVCAWCAGYIEDADINEEINKELLRLGNLGGTDGLYQYVPEHGRTDCPGQSPAGNFPQAADPR